MPEVGPFLSMRKARTDGSMSPMGKTRFREDMEVVHRRGGARLVTSVATREVKSHFLSKETAKSEPWGWGWGRATPSCCGTGQREPWLRLTDP